MLQAITNSISGKANHTWRFFRAGGFDQVRLETGKDLEALDQLDQKLWVALSCPTRGVEFDPRTLDLIDTDKDGRIRAPEILAAVRWATANLKRPEDLVQGAEALPLSAINDATDEGRQLLASSSHILESLGKAKATAITVADTTDTARIFAQTKFNGDGIIPPESADDEAARGCIRDVLLCLGGETDRAGLAGVSQTKVDQFFAELQACSDWWSEAEREAARILPLGEATAQAQSAIDAVRAKVDDFFTRCRLAAFDSRAEPLLNRSEAELAALAPKEFSASGAELAGFPLARVAAGRPLPLLEGVNPAWAEALQRLHREAVVPLLGLESRELSAEGWNGLNARLAPYASWCSRKAGAAVEKLGLVRVRALLASDLKAQLSALIARDKALEPEMNAITAVERLVRYHRDLYRLLNNFVTFAEFYSGKHKAIFQVGTLYLDGRSCELCVKVEDVGKHSSLAPLSKTYLAYCDCVRPSTKEKMTIAAAFTAGDSNHLLAGRNGVFYDRKGQDWDATITKIIEHPISIGQAIWSPYKRIGRMVGEQIEKLAAARDKAMQDEAAAKVAQTSKMAESGKPAAGPAPAPGGVANMVGILAAVGLALGAIGTALATFVKSFLGLSWWQMPLAVLGMMLLVSGPSVIIAWLKLRQRNLAPILDANGWAVNGRVRINIPFGGALTATAKLPPNAVRALEDPYAEKHPVRGWLMMLFLAVLLGAAGYYWYQYSRTKSQPKASTKPVLEAPQKAAPASPAAGAK